MTSQANKKRELVFVALAVIGLIYGAVDFALSTTGKDARPSGTGVLAASTFSLITEELSTNSTRQQEVNALEILKVLSAVWPEGVFADIGSFVKDQEKEDVFTLADDAFVYSGYMTMGGVNLAVVNGIDYRVGDMVEGFSIREIDSMEIVMEKNGRPARVPFRRIE